MNKSDLKFGMVVELKNGALCLIEPVFNYCDEYVEDYITRHEDEDDVQFRNIESAELDTTLSSFNDDLTNKNIDKYTIIKVYKDYTLKKVLWERKEPLLTPEERDWLAAVIKPFRDKVVDISLQSGEFDEAFISIDVEGDSVTLPYIEHLPFKFKGLEVDKFYALDELGL